MNRRDFLKTSLTLLASSTFSFLEAKANKLGTQTIRIIHTNDTHSQIEPLPLNHPKYPGRGGYAARAAVVNKLRAEGYPTLLLDSGDVFQGTPYYNFYKGELEMKLMSDMKYDAMAIGNHEFDGGIDGLYEALKFARFPVLSSNYDFSKTKLSQIIKPYIIYRFNHIKIGIFSLLLNPDGLIEKKLLGEVKYKDPEITAAYFAHFLKKKKKCHAVICLSHLGLDTSSNSIGDFDLAKKSKNIDLILGGHSHTLLQKPIQLRNSDGKTIIITQNGAYGVQLTIVDMMFNFLGDLVGVNSYTNFLKKQG
ncbi:MAG: metallophosphatase [Bacteroidales bacterium]|nr:metallophosphatase [Bacteroidales bacterium]